MDKIIKKEGRIILIESELSNKEHWNELFDSLTFAEGMAMAQAIQEWTTKNGFAIGR